jgi:hypothetical protein
VGALFLASSLATFAIYSSIFDLLHRYDWDQPVVKFACLEALFVLVLLVFFWRRARAVRPPDWVVAAELALACAVLSWELVRLFGLFHVGLRTSMNDLGTTTEDAVRLVLQGHANPYLHQIAKNGDDPAFFGFKYGPGMLIGYALSALWPEGRGLKTCNLLYLAITVGLLAGLAARSEATSGRRRWLRLAPAAVVAALALWPERLYSELFNQGAVDMYPIMLLVAAVACLDKKWWLGAGLAAGLSFSAKFSPAAFLLILFVRRRIPRRFVVGVAIGLVPFLPFLLWDAPSLVRNVFIFHSKKSFDATSLYSVTPSELHYLFSAFQACAVAATVIMNFRRPIEPRSLVVFFTLLLIAIEVSYREIHGNHLIWFVPVAALSLTWYRHWLGRGVGARLLLE